MGQMIFQKHCRDSENLGTHRNNTIGEYHLSTFLRTL